MINEPEMFLIRFLQLFQNVTAAEQALIKEHMQVRAVKTGDILLHANDKARELFFICDGILKITTTNEKGTQVTQFFLKENQFCTILRSFLSNTNAEENIMAACDGVLLVFSKSKLVSLYQQIPWLEELITSIMNQALLDKIQIRNAYMGEDATTRYKKFMARQADIALRVPLSDVASYLGITQQSLSRIRRSIR
jgi:CRP-like cAMP-binding protein